MKKLIEVLKEYLEKKLVDDLGPNDGEADILECVGNDNLFLEDVTGGYWYIIKIPNFGDDCDIEPVDLFEDITYCDQDELEYYSIRAILFK